MKDGLPLMKTSGGVLVPAMATAPCDCCDGGGGNTPIEDQCICQVNQRLLTQYQVVVEGAGDDRCDDPTSCDSLNGVYLLEYTTADPYPGCGSVGWTKPNGCFWHLDLDQDLCVDGYGFLGPGTTEWRSRLIGASLSIATLSGSTRYLRFYLHIDIATPGTSYTYDGCPDQSYTFSYALGPDTTYDCDAILPEVLTSDMGAGEVGFSCDLTGATATVSAP